MKKDQFQNKEESSQKKNKKGQKKEIHSDVLGSYTGVPEGPDERPIQDADDL